ncbi:hypothetical protein NMG60_11012322 [Bertholletia excelsa]
MAHPLALSLTSTGVLNFGLTPRTYVSCRKGGASVLRSSTRRLSVRAVQENDRPRRLVDIVRLVPEISKNYFRSPSRRALFGGIALLGGFYVAQTISLSFGVISVNDVIAAVVCVLLTEYVTKFYYSQPKVIKALFERGVGHVIASPSNIAQLKQASIKPNTRPKWSTCRLSAGVSTMLESSEHLLSLR